MRISYQGKPYDVPDDASVEELNALFGVGKPSESQAYQQGMSRESPSKPFGLLPDIGTGLMRGLQGMTNISSFLPNQFGVLAPFINKPDPMAMMMGRGTQFNPYETFGTKPASIKTPEGAAQLGGELLPLAPLAMELPNILRSSGNVAKNILNYMRPGQASKNFLKDLSGVSSEVNAERAAETIATAHDVQKAEALQHKQNVLDQAGETNLSQMPGFDIQKVAKVLKKNINEINRNQIKSLKNAVDKYRKDDDFGSLLNKSEKIFDTDLTESQMEKLEDLVSSRRTRYEQNEDVFSGYDKKLKSVHNDFMQNKSLENADRLIKELNNRIYKYKDLQDRGMLQPSDSEKLDDFMQAKKDLLHDMDTHMEGQSVALRQEYTNYRRKWAMNVEPYYDNPKLARMAMGDTKGTKPSELRNIFSYPDSNVQKVLGDLPQEGKNYILYNELIGMKPTNPKKLLNALTELEQHKGYGQYFTPEMREFKNKLSRQVLAKKAALWGMGSLLGLGLGELGLGVKVKFGGSSEPTITDE